MKVQLANQRRRALTFVELLAIIACVAVLVAMLLSVLAATHSHDGQINCISNLRQINLAYRLSEGDDNGEPISSTPRASDSTLSLNEGQRAWVNFMGISNLLGSAKFLRCPADKEPSVITDSTGNKIELSYFLCPNATESYPQMVLDGDDNLAINDVPVKPGILEITNCGAVTWTGVRHGHIGTIGFADGSVAEESSSGLQTCLAYATNGTPFPAVRLAIP